MQLKRPNIRKTHNNTQKRTTHSTAQHHEHPHTHRDRAEFEAKSKKLPPSLFAHNIMQRSLHTVHAQKATAKGILGRALDALQSQQDGPYRFGLYSTAGFAKMLETNSQTPSVVSPNKGQAADAAGS